MSATGTPARTGSTAGARHIDIHTHVVIPEVLELARAVKVRGSGPGKQNWIPEASRAVHAAHSAGVDEKLRNAAARIADMDAMGVDVQVVSMNLPTNAYWAAAATGRRIARTCNEGIAAFVATMPERFVGIGALPLQDMDASVREMHRLREMGLRGVQIPSVVRNRDLGEAHFRPFWACAEKLGLPVIIHPRGFTHDDRLHKFFLWNTVGQPLEEALAMASIIHEGILDAFPGLKIVMSHGGGYLPYYSGRGDRAFTSRPEPGQNIGEAPSRYFPRFHYDSVVFDPGMISRLADMAGVSQIMMGTDYPRGEIEEDPVGFVHRVPGLDDAARRRILSTNAAALFGIDAETTAGAAQ